MLNHPSLAERIPGGLIAANDDYSDRVVIIDPHTRKIIWQYGHTDTPGRAPGYLHIPDGFDLWPPTELPRLTPSRVERILDFEVEPKAMRRLLG